MSGKTMTITDWSQLAQRLSTFPAVVAAWVFGSGQSGIIREGGDIDVAILFDRKPALDQLAELRAALQDSLNFDAIDLVTLNDASPITRFEAISGRRLFCRDWSRLAEFASLTAREYEDEMAMLQKALQFRQRMFDSG